MKRFWFVLLLASVIACCSGTAFADDSSISEHGGSATPMGSTTISMAAETVQCIAFQRFAEYRVDFRFVNRGAPQTLLLGFPFYLDGDSPSPVASFRAWRNGAEIPVRPIQGRDLDQDADFYAHDVYFPTGVTTVTVDYLASPSSSQFSDDEYPYAAMAKGTPFAKFPASANDYPYTLHTGANWAGPIGLAVLRWTLSPDFVGWGIPKALEQRGKYEIATANDPDGQDPLAAQMAGIESGIKPLGKDAYQLVLRSFEPTEDADGYSAYDVSLPYLYQRPNEHHQDPPGFYGAWAQASSWLKRDGNDYDAGLAVDGDPSTAWATDADGSGVDEYLDVRFPAKQTIRELRVVSGAAVDPKSFRENNRPHHLKLAFSDGTSTKVELADTPALQRIPVRAHAKSVRVTIEDIYPGTSADDDTYLSEIEFGAAPSPIFENPSVILASQDPDFATAETALPRMARSGPAASPSLADVASWVVFGAALLGLLTFVLLTRPKPAN